MKTPNARERLDRTVAPAPQRNDTGADRCAPPRSEDRSDPLSGSAPPTVRDLDRTGPRNAANALWLEVDLSGVGERARRIRTIIGLSQAKVARRLGWCREVYGRFERDLHGPSVPSVLAVAAALHVHPNALLDDGWRDLGLEWTGDRTVSVCRRAIATRSRAA